MDKSEIIMKPRSLGLTVLSLMEPRPGHCPRCGAQPFRVVAVHGHRQCVACGANVEPCCED